MAVRDLIVVGGGPAGLAVAIAAALRGVDVLVVERGGLPADKACGEGILPAGVRALDALGVTGLIAPDGRAPVAAIRWIDGTAVAEAQLPPPGGLGVRRTALSAALHARARALGIEVRTGVAVLAHSRRRDAVEVSTAAGVERARLLVAADGLASPIRRREGLDGPSPSDARFGIRRHFAATPWTAAVEVHFGDGIEAYVTPAGPHRVGVALLCERSARGGFDALLPRFPELARRLEGAPFDSSAAGAGPFPRSARRRALDRLVLVGDAAGYVDAITGEGVSLAIQGAIALARDLPGVLAAGASRRALAPWERGEALRFARYAWTARAVLALARRGAARRHVLRFVERRPRLLQALVGISVG